MEKTIQTAVTRCQQASAALERAHSTVGSFSVLLCALDTEQAEKYREALVSSLSLIPQFDVADKPIAAPMEQSICLRTASFDAVCEDPFLLLEQDFLVCFADTSDASDKVKALLQLTGGYAWLICEDDQRWKGLKLCTYGDSGIFEAKKLGKKLHGMVSYEGGKLRRNFGRNAVKVCIAARKEEIAKKTELQQKRFVVRQDLQKLYFRKFLFHWNESDNALSDKGDYLLLLEEILSRCDDPESFAKEARRLLLEESKRYFKRLGDRYVHAIPRSSLCRQMSDDFYRIVLDQYVMPPVKLGEQPMRWWNHLFGIRPKPVYNDYQKETLAVWKAELLPALQKRLRRSLSEYEEEYRRLTVYPDLTDYAEEYMEWTELEMRLSWEEYL